jgi:2-oxoglutarate dehydrogenase E2 component (dihydrolipoamide succinyltransferase)
MAIEIKIPEVGESVTEALVSRWFKAEGDRVERDEPIAELETDKVTVEFPAPAGGVLSEIRVKAGETAQVGQVIAILDEAEASTEASTPKRERAAATDDGETAKPSRSTPSKAPKQEPTAPAPAPATKAPVNAEAPGSEKPRIMPAARRLLEQHDLDPAKIPGTGPGQRVLKEDVERHLAEQDRDRERLTAKPATSPQPVAASGREEERVPMSPIRRRIAERLVAAQSNAALLTTFNEIDMSAVVATRQRYRDVYEKAHGVRLGFMSFFVKAAVDALRRFPQLNAEVQGTDIVYKNYFDIGIAVSTDRGLVVPVLRNVERLGFAEIELAIADFGERARNGKLRLEELQGGTFTISNGGVFGSLLSTPLVNPPQSGVLGLHAIQDRPVARDGQVVVLPMMYVALTYDHRIVDGREAVTCLRRIKETVEDPTRMLLEV